MLPGAADVMVCTAPQLVVTQELQLQQQQPGSTSSWQYLYPSSSQGASNVLFDLQNMHLT